MADKVSLKTLALSKRFTSDSVIGLGAIKGANATVKDVEPATGGQNVIFEWTATDGTKRTRAVFVPDGRNVESAYMNSENHLIIVMSDGSEVDAGELPSGSGGTEYVWEINGSKLEVTDSSTGIKQSLQLPTSSAGGIENDLPVGLDVGGIKKPKTYVAGTGVETILNDLLNPVMNPMLTNPSASISYSSSSPLPVGTTIDAKTATVSLNRGSINPQYTADEPYRSGAATGYSLKVDGATTPFNESNTTGTFSVPAITRHLKGDITLTATASYGQGCQPKNSVGENYSTPLQAGTVSVTKKISFILPFRYGATDTKDLTSLDGLETDISGKANKEYYFTTTNQYCVMAYDSSYGDLSLIQDQNGFNTTGSWEKRILGEYTYYVSQSKITDTNAKSTFIF